MKVGKWTCLAWIFLSLTGCSVGRADQGRPNGSTRIATYNIQWFSEDANAKRVENLKSVLNHIRPDVVGLQEIQSRRALDQIFGPEWSIGMADDQAEDQELAIAVRKPYVLVSSELLFEGPVFEDAFPGRRDVLRCVIQTPRGGLLVAYVVHMKSRVGGRKTTDARREAAAALLAGYVRGHVEESNFVVMGDFNDTPDDTSVRILETGDLSGGKGGRLLTNLCSPLWDQDVVTEGLTGGRLGAEVNPKAKGAKSDNARLRGRDYEFPAEARVPQALFDQILVSRPLAKTRAIVYAGPDALTGQAGRTSKTDDGTLYKLKGDLASDHLPVFADVWIP